MSTYNPGPVFTRTSGFGPRILNGKPDNHTGIDYAAARGTPIPAAAAGVVVYSGYNSQSHQQSGQNSGGFGNTVIVQHTGANGDAFYTVYAHMDSRLGMLNAGDLVQAGTILGTVGDTGTNAGGPHLHFEIIKGRTIQKGATRIQVPTIRCSNNGGPLGPNPDDLRVDPDIFSNWPTVSVPTGFTFSLLCYPKDLKSIKQAFATASITRSPIVLDLNGDGLTTTGLQAGTFFDHDANGFAEQTGWVGPHDGLLVRDLNGNGTIDSGRELFGSETLLANGQKAAHGFEALAELDRNRDGQITQQDAAYATLKIWKDIDGNGYSSPDELSTLADTGIHSIATGYSTVNQTDAAGNTIRQAGTFTRADGSSGVTADIYFQVDTTNTIATDWLPETAAVTALPDLQGFGTVYNLHQAMLRDGSGRLQALVQHFANETDPAARHALMIPLLYAWAGVAHIAPASRSA